MVCNKCGIENPDRAKFCNGCGERLYPPDLKPADCATGPVAAPSKICPPSGLSNPASASTCDCGNASETRVSQAPNHLNTGRQDSRKQLSGVGGWLLFLCLVLCVFSPAGWLILLVANPQLQLVPVGALIAYGFVAGYKLWRIRPGAVRFARTFLIVNISVNACIVLAEAIFLIPVAASKNMGTITWSIIWFLYLRKSTRVAATFREKPQDEADQTLTVVTLVPTKQAQLENAKRGLGFESDEEAHRDINQGGAVLEPPMKNTAPPPSAMNLPEAEHIPPAETTSGTPSEATEREADASHPLKAAEAAQPTAKRMAEDSSLLASSAGTHNYLKHLIVIGVVLVAAIGGILLLRPLIRYKYLKRGSIPYRYDRYSGRTDVFTAEGWAPVSFDRPLIKIPSAAKIHVSDQANINLDESEICVGVDNNSNYMVKSISVHLNPGRDAKGDNYVAQALLTDGLKILVPGAQKGMCGTIVDRDDYTPLSTYQLRTVSSVAGKWEFSVEEVEGWKP